MSEHDDSDTHMSKRDGAGLAATPSADGERRRAPECAICGKPQDEAFKPFCCKRCADVDLGRWLGGRYAIAARDDDGRSELEPIEGARRH
jgi:hypothetical protein